MLGLTLPGLDVHDGMCAIDYLCEQDFVDPSRIGVIGLSQGGVMSTWIPICDDRIYYLKGAICAMSTNLSVDFTITSALPVDLGVIPLSPVIDFAELIRQADAPGRLDPNSVSIVNKHTEQVVPHGLSEDFNHGDAGRLEWSIADPTHTRYEVRFSTCAQRPPLEPQALVPLIGVGDLLRYNAGEPRPIAIAYAARLVDLTGDGRQDLAGCWNYYHRPGAPRSGVVCYPRTGQSDRMEFGDLTRLRYVESEDSDELHHFPGTYMEADFADFTGNGLPDVVFAEASQAEVSFFLNTGRRDDGGVPILIKDRAIAVPIAQLGGLLAVDFDGDGVLDLVVGGQFIRNTNADGWPFEPAAPVDLGLRSNAALMDLTGNSRLDAIEFEITGRGGPVQWRARVDGEVAEFAPAVPLTGIPLQHVNYLAAARDGAREGLLVQHDNWHKLDFFELVEQHATTPRVESRTRLKSLSAVLCCSDQAWPCICDWGRDGVNDLLIGGGYGWPRIVRNRGTNSSPVFDEPQRLHTQDGPVRVLRNEILSSQNWHNMGYPYPVFVDWDGDGLPDLMLPNETNRIVWHRNVGTHQEPEWGPRQHLEVDGYPDSDDARAAIGRIADNRDTPNQPYPHDPTSPFMWRTGGAFADWNADGLMDLITHDADRKATLFLQYVAEDGTRRLRRQGRVRLVDGREIDDSIVGRTKHWTESFRAVDWDGDGLIDLVYSCAGTGYIYLLRNVGSRTEPVFDLPRQFKCYGEPISFTVHGPNAWAGDLDGDGKPDLLGCVEWSVYPFYRHAALEMDEHPAFLLGGVQPQR
jgi:hypothetical protein